MHQSIPQTPSHARVFTACLLSFMILMAPIASIAGATLRATAPARATKKQLSAAEKLEAALFEPALAPVVSPIISATKTDSFSDPDGDGKAVPSATITYDVNVNNSGGDATGVQFNDTID